MSLARNSDRNIKDPIIRGLLYDEIKAATFSNPIEHEIKPDELNRADLVSYRVYSNPALYWVVLVAAGVEDEKDNMQYGQKLLLPPANWVRSRIRHFAAGGGIE